MSVNRQNDYLLGAIQEIIRKETMFLRHYYGKVTSNVDSQKKGTIRVTIEELQILSPNYLVCFPRQNNSLTLPNINDYVEVYFMAGRAEHAVYLYPAAEMQNMANKAATADTFLDILYSNPSNAADLISHHKTTRIMKILNLFELSQIPPEIKMLNGSEPFVLGNQLVTWLTNFITTVFNLHTHPTAGTGPPSIPSIVGTPPSGITSIDIMGK